MFKKLLFLLLFFLLFSNVNALLTDNIVSYWNFDETSGTIAPDSIGNYDATLSNSALWTLSGKINEGINFNAGNYNIDTGYALNSTNDFTISFWADFTTSGTLKVPISTEDAVPKTGFSLLSADGTSYFIAVCKSGSCTDTSSFNPSANYNFYTITHSGDDWNIYENNVLKVNSTITGHVSSGLNLYFGSRPANDRYENNLFDEVGIWNRVLTTDEITKLYNNGDALPYPFDKVTADFNYELVNSNGDLNLINNSSISGDIEITDVNWFLDDTQIGTGESLIYNIEPNIDYNFGIFVDTNDADFNDWYYETVNFPSRLTFNFYDENSLVDLNGVSYSISPSINGISSGTLTDNNLDLNLVGITATEYLFTFTKTGYGTRYYQTELNQFSDIDINFGMLSNELGRNIEFQIYNESEVLYPNQFVEFYNWESLTYAGKRKTNSEGKATFFINPNDANYVLRSNDFDYNAMTLTVNKPKDETTATTIDGNWQMDVGGLAWQSYTDITGNQAIQIYANTSADYELAISDDNSDYFERKYYVNYIGGTTAETLQPYLVPTNQAVSTTIFTISAFTQQPVGDITIQIYKTLEGAGRVLVEQVVTDDKGEALVSLIANDSYEFEIYRNSTLQGTLNIVATSTSIYINISDLTVSQGQLNSGFVNVLFNPNRGRLIGTDTSLTQTISVTDKNSGLEFTSARIIVTNTDINGVFGNDLNIYDETITILTNSIDINSIAQTLNGVNYDTNGHLIVTVIVTTNQGTQTFNYIYKPVNGFDVYKAIGYDLRPFFGCTSTTNPLIPCAPMLGIAIFISLLITIGFVIETGFTGQNSIAGVFLVIMGIFTYFAWVPIGIMAIMTVGYIMISLALGGKQV